MKEKIQNFWQDAVPVLAAVNREGSQMILFFLVIFAGPILLVILVELVFGLAFDRYQMVRRRESPREYWYIVLLHSVILVFVVGFFLFYLFFF